jgi:hypothetical protein
VAASVEFKCPLACINTRFKLELASQTWADGADAFYWLKSYAFVRNEGGGKTTNGYRRLIYEFNYDHDDIFVIVINVH